MRSISTYELPTYPLAKFSRRGDEYVAKASALDKRAEGFAACFAIDGQCTHGFRVIIRGVPRLFLLKPDQRRKTWTFVQVEGGKRTVRILDN